MFADREGKPLKRLQEVFVILPMVETMGYVLFPEFDHSPE